MNEVAGDLAPVLTKLARSTRLTDDDCRAFRAVPFKRSIVGAGKTLVKEGDPVDSCFILLEGFAARHKMTGEGKRQIVSFHQAGDIVDLQHLHFARADHSIQLITHATVARVSDAALRALIRDRPTIAEAFWRETMIDASIFREAVLNVGRRDAKSRIAHMLCEMACRADAAGLGSSRSFQLPLTQEQIADATGLTSVHVNRMMRELSEEGAITRRQHNYVISNWDRMRRIADFDPTYLHIPA